MTGNISYKESRGFLDNYDVSRMVSVRILFFLTF